MDKSIKERAKEYAPYAFHPDYILTIREEYIINQQRKAYIAGAREQKSVDEEVRLKKCADKPPYNNAVYYAKTPNEALQGLYDWCVKNGFIND